MKNTIDILDALKRHFSVETDYQLHMKTGWSKSKISGYRTQHRSLDPFEAVQAANWLNESPLKLIAICEAERTKRPERKKAWLEVAKVALFASAMIGGGNFGGPAPAKASSGGSSFNTSYTLSDLKRRRRKRGFLENTEFCGAHA